jgi:hypothetical protein
MHNDKIGNMLSGKNGWFLPLVSFQFFLAAKGFISIFNNTIEYNDTIKWFARVGLMFAKDWG